MTLERKAARSRSGALEHFRRKIPLPTSFLLNSSTNCARTTDPLKARREPRLDGHAPLDPKLTVGKMMLPPFAVCLGGHCKKSPLLRLIPRHISQIWTSVHRRPRFAKLSFHGGGKEQIAPVHLDFACGNLPLSLMGLAGWLPIHYSHLRCRGRRGFGQPRSDLFAITA
jgi:hypothetical protein